MKVPDCQKEYRRRQRPNQRAINRTVLAIFISQCCRESSSPFDTPLKLDWSESRSHLRVDIGGDAGNVHLDSLGEAGERPALPRNCKMSITILVESGDRANRWSRKNLRGRGRLQDAHRRSAGTYPRGDSSLLATSIFNPRSLGRATWKTKANRICCATRRSRGRGAMLRRLRRRSPLMWGSLG
jgi:hypothetical protein